jgi:16S rRNA (adenine1518-N6/adenine1519-N6)-dimethyltransferase
MFERRRPTRRKTSIRKGGAAKRAQERPRDPGRHERSEPSREVRALLDRFGLRAQKGFGQNFLTDPFVLDAILAAADLGKDEQVVEVGPGLGVLTRALAERARRVVAVEIDRGMVAALAELLADCPNVEVVEGDALTLDPGPLVGEAPYKVVANLPYYITSRLLRHFFEAARRPTRLVVMVQREVAERVVAPAGELSLLAVSVQYYGQPSIVGHIPASAFFPVPKVDSAILRVDVRDRPAVDVEPARFFKVVSAGFAMPRKQLHNVLPQKIWMPPGAAEQALRAIGVDPMRRAQTMTLDEWAALTGELARREIV